MTSKWTYAQVGRENPGQFDTGNGAIATIEINRSYPGIARVTIRSYCGRTYDNRRYYRFEGDGIGAFVKPDRPRFATLKEAMR